MLTHFAQAIPEVSVSNVEKAAEYYVNVLGFQTMQELKLWPCFSADLPATQPELFPD